MKKGREELTADNRMLFVERSIARIMALTEKVVYKTATRSDMLRLFREYSEMLRVSFDGSQLPDLFRKQMYCAGTDWDDVRSDVLNFGLGLSFQADKGKSLDMVVADIHVGSASRHRGKVSGEWLAWDDWSDTGGNWDDVD